MKTGNYKIVVAILGQDRCVEERPVALSEGSEMRGLRKKSSETKGHFEETLKR